jgi:hypothetical protein
MDGGQQEAMLRSLASGLVATDARKRKNMRRKRFQRGNIMPLKRNGKNYWLAQWREDGNHRTKELGLTIEVPTRKQCLRTLPVTYPSTKLPKITLHPIGNSQFAPEPRILSRIKERIETGLNRELPLETLTKESGYSREHFLLMFRAATGMTPHQ